MKRKGDNITITSKFTVDNKSDFEKEAQKYKNDQFEIADGETVIFTSGEKKFELKLTQLKEPEKRCLKELSQLKDMQRLNMSYRISKNRIWLSFFITRLTEEDIDKTLFDVFSLTDIDPKAMVGLFTDGKFHG